MSTQHDDIDTHDLDIDERLRRFAAGTRTPPLPDEVADLPWAVQTEKPRRWSFGFSVGLRNASATLGRAAVGGARIAATLIVAAGLLLVFAGTRTGGSSAGLIQPPPTPRPSVEPAGDGPKVIVLPAHGVVDGVMADYIDGGISKAESDGAVAVIVQLDTLGGDSESMMRIVKSLHAGVPTIVWVGPAGAKAASAGTFITLSSSLAYMAPSTNIGAAAPVAPGGGDIETTYGQTEADKIMNDAVATIRSIAQERHPEAVEWAASTVRDARSYTSQEALDAKAIDGIAASLDEVLARADGQTVTVNGAPVVVHTSGATMVTIEEDVIQSILHGLHDPNIAFILLVLGVLLVAVEFFHPTLAAGLSGALALALAFYGFGSLPLNWLGLILIVLGLVMLMLEPAVPSHGALTFGGLACFIVGAVAFYGSPGPYLPAAAVAWPIIVTMAVLAGLYGLVFVNAALKIRNTPVPEGTGMVGTESVVGSRGKVQAALDPIGTVHVSRESWTAREAHGATLARGTRVKVIRQEGLTLVVEKVE